MIVLTEVVILGDLTSVAQELLYCFDTQVETNLVITLLFNLTTEKQPSSESLKT